jgi:hypothetical protein
VLYPKFSPTVQDQHGVVASGIKERSASSAAADEPPRVRLLRRRRFLLRQQHKSCRADRRAAGATFSWRLRRLWRALTPPFLPSVLPSFPLYNSSSRTSDRPLYSTSSNTCTFANAINLAESYENTAASGY